MSSPAASEPRVSPATPVPLEFSNSTDCLRWVEAKATLESSHLHGALRDQLAALACTQIDPVERLRILEGLRGLILSVQTLAAKQYEGKPLPLPAEGRVSWDRAIGTWREVKANYQISLDAFTQGHLEMAPHAAFVVMRCLDCVAESITEHYRAYQEVPAALWRELHDMYSLSEKYGFTRLTVHDGLTERDPATSCHEVYTRALMLGLANPYSLSPRQVRFVRAWLAKWASLVILAMQPRASPIPTVGIDLSGTKGVVYGTELKEGAGVRYLDLEQISATLQLTIKLLKQGQTPAQLGLGADAHQPGCENLLMLLYLQWCRAGIVRTEQREDADTVAEICLGISAICEALRQGRAAGKPAVAAGAHRDGNGMALSPEFTSCRILNYSTGGLMGLQHGEYRPERSIAHGQLIGVRRAGSQFHRAGVVQWIIAGENDLLRFGVRLFPGVPEPVRLQPANPAPAGRPPFEHALLFPELPMPSTPASLVLPSGSFATGRVLDMRLENETVTISLLHTLDQGSNFERHVIKVL